MGPRDTVLGLLLVAAIQLVAFVLLLTVPVPSRQQIVLEQARRFSGVRSVPGNETGAGEVHLVCPAGTEVSIQDAFYRVRDPRGECGALPPSMHDCTTVDSGSLGCVEAIADLQNEVCAPDGTGACRPRDASPYLAAFCEGKRSCRIPLNQSIQVAVGPDPCNEISLTPPISALNLTSYAALPESAMEGTVLQGYELTGTYTCVPAPAGDR